MVFSQLLNSHRLLKRLVKTLIRLRICAGWSKPLLVAHTTLLEIPCHGSYEQLRERERGRERGREREGEREREIQLKQQYVNDPLSIFKARILETTVCQSTMYTLMDFQSTEDNNLMLNTVKYSCKK